tara:strand:- start:62 stop:277 length:216 start_codon:yes stop_codon:yes gene_type:complete
MSGLFSDSDDEIFDDKYIPKILIDLPKFVINSHMDISISLNDGDINLLKSIIAYRNYKKKIYNENIMYIYD